MRNDFTPIREALNSLTQTIADMHKEMLAKANAERVELIALYARMKDTQSDLDELAMVAADASKELAAVDEVATAHAVLIEDAIYGGPENIPDCDYEAFVGFCDECGGSVDARTDYHKEGDVLMCAECHDFYEKVEEDNGIEEPVETDAVVDVEDDVECGDPTDDANDKAITETADEITD